MDNQGPNNYNYNNGPGNNGSGGNGNNGGNRSGGNGGRNNRGGQGIMAFILLTLVALFVYALISNSISHASTLYRTPRSSINIRPHRDAEQTVKLRLTGYISKMHPLP